jgi:preprotein translocase subunit SecD
MEFLAASQLPEGGTLKPGASVPAGTYKPAVAGKDIASVQWAVSENDGINQEVLALHLSAAGTKHMATLTKSIVGHHLLVLLGGRVLSNELVTVPITHGQLAFDSAYVLSMRSEIDSATVPSP